MIKLNFSEDWKDLGLSIKRTRQTPSPVSAKDALSFWLESTDKNRDWLAVLGPNPQTRTAVYRSLGDDAEWDTEVAHAREWLNSDAQQAFVKFASRIKVDPQYSGKVRTGRPWEWLWGLLEVESLGMSDNLRRMAGRGTSPFYDVILHFFEVRFRIQEKASEEEVNDLFETFVRWLTNQVLTPEETRQIATIQQHIGGVRPAYSVVHPILFLLIFAHQNGIIGSNVLILDDIETAIRNEDRARLKSLQGLLTVLSRWSDQEPLPISALVGLDWSVAPQLRRMQPKLWEEISIRKSPAAV